jgi:lysyl-tRNA synthetase, class II
VTDDSQTDHEASRAEKLRRIEALGIDPWGGRFDGHTPIADVLALPADAPEGQRPRARAAGRILQLRDQGNIYFADIWDWTTPTRVNDQGQERRALQVMIGKKQVGEVGWQLTQLLDLGDLIGVDGTYGKSRKGEPTLFAERLTYLTKSLEPHPTTFYGLHDVELRQRMRYLDLIHNPETLRRARERITVVKTIRNYLDRLGFIEVETPTLHAIAGGAAARPFVTHHNALDIDLFLRIALELHLKRLLVGGMEKVYELGRVFRNEGISRKHNPEFTMLELYQAYSDYRGMMDLTEGMIVACVDALGRGRQLSYAGKPINFEPPFQRSAYTELFRGHVGVALDDNAGIAAAAERRGLPVAGKHHDVLVHQLFEMAVEDQLTGPVFVYDYPAALCPLTKRRRDNPAVAERFELYVHGMELANAYTELNDPVTQEATFRQQLAGLPEEDSMARMDDDFVRALRHGMPPAGGLGVGVDRLCMLLTDATQIGDVILFPLLRPEA